MVANWAHSPADALIQARTTPQPPGVVPHHLRCDWMRGPDRCALPDGHTGEHKAREEKR